MAIKIGGTAFLKVDGNQYPLRGNFTVSPNSVERTMVAGQDYAHGFTEVPRVPFIEGDISTLPDILFGTLEQMVNVTVTAELLNGRRRPIF
jgi:Phage tail tube protein